MRVFKQKINMKRHTLIIILLLTGVFLCSFSVLYDGLTKMQEARYAQEETEDNPKWTEEQEREEPQSAAHMTQTAPPPGGDGDPGCGGNRETTGPGG